MAVRSTRLTSGGKAGVGTPTEDVIYTCPAGTIALVKDVLTAVSGGAPVQLASVRIDNVFGTQNLSLTELRDVNIPAREHFVGFVVLEAGDRLVFQFQGPPTTQGAFWVSGAELII